MNRREKLLLFLVVGTLLAGVGSKVVREQIIERIQRMDREIAAKQAKLNDIRTQRVLAVSQRHLWETLSAETLSSDVSVASTKLVGELGDLAGRHGLQKVAVRPTAPSNVQNAYHALVFNLDADARLREVVSFLYDLYNLPFITRVRTITLSPVSGKDRDTLRLSLKGETIVLPPQKLAPRATTAPTDEANRKNVVRTAFDDVKAYMVIAEKRLFEPYTAPAPHVASQPVLAKGPDLPPPPPPPPPPAAPPPPQRKRHPGRGSTRISAILSTPTEQWVVLTGNDNSRQEVKVGEELDGGKLVYVHPDGAVVVYKPPGGHEWEKEIYPVGKLLSDSKPLTEKDFPEAFFVVSQMEKGSAALPAAKTPAGG